MNMAERTEQGVQLHLAHRPQRGLRVESSKRQQQQQLAPVHHQGYSYSARREPSRNLQGNERELQPCSHPHQGAQFQHPRSSVQSPPQEQPSAPIVLFDTSKDERGDPSSTYRQLARQLQEEGVRVEVNSRTSLTLDTLRYVSLVVLAHPSQPFSSAEINVLREFLKSGKSILAMLGEGGERETKTNINYFLEEYGLTICSDTVVRSVVAAPAHLHPKETLVTDGFLCAEPAREWPRETSESPTRNNGSRRNTETGIQKGRRAETCTDPSSSCDSFPSTTGENTCIDYSRTSAFQLLDPTIRRGSSSSGSRSCCNGPGVGQAPDSSENMQREAPLLLDGASVPFVFPYGATVSVQAPAFPFISSGLVAFPPRRPLGAAYVDPSSDGRLVALGSYRMFDDAFLHKEGNKKVQQLVFAWLLRQQPAEALHPRQRLDSTSCNADDVSRPVPTGDQSVEADLAERSQAVPDTAGMAERVMPCFQESEHRLPPDFHDLHEEKLYSVNLDLLPEVKNTYKRLNVKYEPLSMIEPEFEVPLPRYIPAVHPPLRMELSPPPLELFDLDEELASPRTRLAHLTNRCTDTDLAYYVCEAADIVGYEREGQNSEVDDGGTDEEIAKKILWDIFEKIVSIKQHVCRMAATGTEKEERNTKTPTSSENQ